MLPVSLMESVPAILSPAEVRVPEVPTTFRLPPAFTVIKGKVAELLPQLKLMTPPEGTIRREIEPVVIGAVPLLVVLIVPFTVNIPPEGMVR